ncbi:LysR family transcriptional regulator [Flavobacterium beibuense]|uniref:RuBisCO operon transcriptional regulator n=1 Tax=Flavobacterium beibuense TaxID=657326 RepID=A0A444WAJ1_9FLAO|nr:LysR family transcriptional regulator [Flavobacterium beibuense]RYJ42842.1 RuBisCO operon transcriptional regulator [Flavobacterium beibuense]
MNYTLNQLQIFLKIAQTLSITKAAEELHLTQPAVSIQLKNFQAQFAMPLTEVVGRKIYITDFGKEIAASAERIIEQVYAINYKTAAYKGLLTGGIKISVVSTGKYVMPYFLSDFLKLHPEVELVMDVTNKREVVESLSRNEVDFSLVSVLPPKLETEKMELLKNKLYLVGNTERSFHKDNTTEIFNELPLIFREEGSGTLQTMMNYLNRNEIRFLKKMELKSNEAVKQAVLSGMGYSIMPLIGIRNELLNNELQIIPVKGLPITTQWTLIWMKGKNHSPAASAYLEFLKEDKQRIITEKFGWYEQY